MHQKPAQEMVPCSLCVCCVLVWAASFTACEAYLVRERVPPLPPPPLPQSFCVPVEFFFFFLNKIHWSGIDTFRDFFKLIQLFLKKSRNVSIPDQYHTLSLSLSLSLPPLPPSLPLPPHSHSCSCTFCILANQWQYYLFFHFVICVIVDDFSLPVRLHSQSRD